MLVSPALDDGTRMSHIAIDSSKARSAPPFILRKIILDKIEHGPIGRPSRISGDSAILEQETNAGKKLRLLAILNFTYHRRSIAPVNYPSVMREPKVQINTARFGPQFFAGRSLRLAGRRRPKGFWAPRWARPARQSTCR